MTEKKLRELEDKVYVFSNKLTGALEALASEVSEILGYDVIADICNGSEVEFRKTTEDVVVDTDSCIRMEDVIKKLKDE